MERASTFVVMMILLFCSVIAHGCIGVPAQSELQDEKGGEGTDREQRIN